MFIKNSQTTNNRDTMNTDQTTKEWGATNVRHRYFIMSKANLNFNYLL